MADIKKVKLPDNSEYNIKDYRIPGVDTEPTSGSDNVITSGGIYAANYAGSTSNGGPANMTVSIPFAKPDTTSTSTAYTVQVDGITELRDGVCFYLMNDIVTSASGFTVNVNDLGAKRVYLTTAAATRATTQMTVNYTWLLVYNETRYSSGCWDLVYTFNSNTTYTINYLLDGSPWYVQHTLYRYQLMFQVDEKTVTPFNANSNTTGTTKTIHTDYEFDPFGKIFYYSTTSTVSANTTVGASYCAFVRAAVDLRYTFNVSTSVNPLSLDYSPVYLKININSTTGMATLNSNLPLTQTLPTTNDGIYYLYLGRSTTTKYTCSLEAHHPIYYHNGTALCELIQEETLNGIEDKLNFVAISDYEDYTLVISAALNDLNDRILDIDTSSMTSVTWAELVTLRDNNQLEPGHQYRITDYVTKVRWNGCKSAEHPFDIIVTANSTNQLSETARAMLHSNDNYFDDYEKWPEYTPRLQQWELKYCLDNDIYRFTWAEPGVQYITIDYSGNAELLAVRNPDYDDNIGSGYYGWEVFTDPSGVGSFMFTLSSSPSTGDLVWDEYEQQIGTVASFNTPDPGKGVIYYMKDEFNNSAYYDFKNVMFERKYGSYTGQYSTEYSPEYGSSMSIYCYTFNCLMNDGNGGHVSEDGTLVCNGNSYYNDGGYNGVRNSKIEPYYEQSAYSPGGGGTILQGQGILTLPNVVVWSTWLDGSNVPSMNNLFIDSLVWNFPTYNLQKTITTDIENKVYSYRFMATQNLQYNYINKDATHSQLTSALNIYNAIHPEVSAPSSSTGSYSISPNVLTTISGTITGYKTFTLSTPADSNIANHYFWTFDTGSTAPTITWPSGLTWPGGSAPAILPNKHYEISVLNNIVAWMEV